MGEALVRTLMAVDRRVFTSGSAFSRADCFLALPTFATSVTERFPWRLLGVFLSKMCEQLRQPAVTVTVSLARTKSKAGAWKEDVCVTLVKLILETLFLVLSEIVSSCFPFNCPLCALHFLFLSFFSLFAFHLCPFPFAPLPLVAQGSSHWRATDTCPLPAAAGDPDPAAGRRKAASACHLLTRFFHRALGGLFSVILGKKQEMAGGTVISAGPEKLDACWGCCVQILRSLACWFKESYINLDSFKCYRLLLYFLLM